MTLDDLALQYTTGSVLEVCVNGNPNYEKVIVIGFDYTVPKEPGGLPEPCIVVHTEDRKLGHVYPEEVVRILL
jgi:hypothetical protein